MYNSRRILIKGCALLTALVLTACASKSDLDKAVAEMGNAKAEIRELVDKNNGLKGQLDMCQAENATVRDTSARTAQAVADRAASQVANGIRIPSAPEGQCPVISVIQHNHPDKNTAVRAAAKTKDFMPTTVVAVDPKAPRTLDCNGGACDLTTAAGIAMGDAANTKGVSNMLVYVNNNNVVVGTRSATDLPQVRTFTRSSLMKPVSGNNWSKLIASKSCKALTGEQFATHSTMIELRGWNCPQVFIPVS